jgi:hypothetical protein
LYVQQVVADRQKKAEFRQHQQRLAEHHAAAIPAMVAVELAMITSDEELLRG